MLKVNTLKKDLTLHKEGLKRDFLLFLCRSGSEDSFFLPKAKQVVPAWSAFNRLLFHNEVSIDTNIGYCPVIGAPPTSLGTVYTLLL